MRQEKMKILCCRSLFALLLFVGVSVAASDASDEYVSIYSLITKGDEMLGSGLKGEAAQFYSDAHRKLVAFRNSYPDWNHQVVRFRLKYLGEKLADLPSIQVEPIQSSVTTSPRPASGNTNLSDQNRMMGGQIAAMNEQMRQLTADNSLLLSKLREAMSARPAEVDPSQVRKAEAKILELEKENELIELQLLRALKPQRSTPPPRSTADDLKDSQELVAKLLRDNEGLRTQVNDQGVVNSQLTDSMVDLNKQIGLLSTDRDALKKQLDQKPAQSNQKQLEKVIRDRESLNKQLATVTADVSGLTAERDQLLKRLQSADAGREDQNAVEDLMRENALLKRQASGSKQTPIKVSGEQEELSVRIKTLEMENSELADQLSKVRRLADRENGSWLPRIGRRGTKNISVLEARLAVLEAEKVPFNVDELALLKGAGIESVLAKDEKSVNTGSKSTAEISQAAAALEAAGQAFARKGAYGEAEAKYDEILDLIPNHAPTLASLALTQLKQQKFGEAEANLEMARKIAPENTYVLFLSGLLKMSQEKFDDAVTYLSRAAVLDPDDAEAQNHLGIALTEVGHRGPAETALRRAIRLRPGYGDAHANLAVVYASQDPPFKELAKYHYQQAINSGHPADPRIEQLINDK
jgi:tetratricopeptide (TPR) repeat protein